MLLIMSFLIYLVKYLFVILKTKFCKIKLLFIIDFEALIYMLLSVFDVFNINVIY
jgi:hypothetical protein